MGEKRTTYLQTSLFAIVFEAVMMLLGWLLIGPPHSMEPVQSLKLTVTVGTPSLTQLLEPVHQFGYTSLQQFGVLSAFFGIISLFLLLLANGVYISLVARSQRTLPGTVWSDAKRALPGLLVWMLFQMLLTAIMAFLLINLGMAGGIISLVLLLWFRYLFFFFDYTVVVRGLRFAPAWHDAIILRKRAKGLPLIFFAMMAVNVLFGYIVNAMFMWPILLLMLVVNALIQTMLQARLMTRFFDALDAS